MYFIRSVGQGYRIGEVVGKTKDAFGREKWLTIDDLDHFFGTRESAKEFLHRKYGAEKDVSMQIILQENQILSWYCHKCAVEVPENQRCKYCGKSEREKS